jgi:deoxyhypusine synthase|tara:strand:+ start:935 stop:1918 length:984 start_codon:yes stop_codon:yes gene_type:complete
MKNTVQHIDITQMDVSDYVDALEHTSFTSREIYNACQLYKQMIEDPNCTIILTIAGSTQAAGCLQLYRDLIRFNMVDVVVATGASIIDMDLYESLGYHHYIGTTKVDDDELRQKGIDRIYDTFIHEEDLKKVDQYICDVATTYGEYRPQSSREFLHLLGQKTPNSLVNECYTAGVPIFCPALNDSAAGFGLLKHKLENDKHVIIDSIQDLKELTELKIKVNDTGLFMIGGGVPKNFAQDIVVAAEMLGTEVSLHKYAVQFTVADPRDGACSSSTLDEACSWGKVSNQQTQMVYGEASSILPIVTNYAYVNSNHSERQPQRLNELIRN